MKFKLINESGPKTYAIIFDKGDEVIANLQKFATQQHVLTSHFTAIGAFNDVVLGFFQPERKEYKKIPIHEQVEVLSLAGDVSLKDEMPNIHAHVVVGKSDGTAHGGHLIEAHVFPTLELILVESPKYVKRRMDKETGFAPIDLDAA
jgi:predicted DNA-binding protein with PD1-like motif